MGDTVRESESMPIPEEIFEGVVMTNDPTPLPLQVTARHTARSHQARGAIVLLIEHEGVSVAFEGVSALEAREALAWAIMRTYEDDFSEGPRQISCGFADEDETLQ